MKIKVPIRGVFHPYPEGVDRDGDALSEEAIRDLEAQYPDGYPLEVPDEFVNVKRGPFSIGVDRG